MNVLQTIVSGNSDVTNKTSRQDRDSSSKRGGSGFSDTLGSIDKGSSSSSNASSASAKPSSASTTTSTSSTATTASNGQPQTPTQTATASDTSTPPTTAPATGAKGIVANAMFLTVGPSQPGMASLGDATLTDATDMTKVTDTVPDNIAQLLDADAAVLPEMSDLAKLVTALSKGAAGSASSETGVPIEGSEETTDPDADIAADDAAGEGMDLLSLLAATTMPVNQNTPPAAQDAGTALSGLPNAGLGAEPTADPVVATSTVVRLQKQDVPAIDFHIETQEDGSAKLDVSKAIGEVTDVVQVVESRRFVGMAAASNATAISSAMAADPDWATTMAGQTSNSPMISSTGQVVHVLKIQMTPVELGHVTAAMKLVGDELSVQLTAHTLKGYSELQKDSSSILDALKSQGFNVDQVTVTLANSADRQDSSTGNRQPQDAGQQGAQQGQRGSDDRPQEQFYRQPGRSAREETTIHETTSQPEIPSRATSARPDHVYL